MDARITEPLVLDLLGWLAREPRSYAEAMDAWRTSCPRLSVWEEAVDGGLVQRGDPVQVTPLGFQLLAENGRGAVILTPGGAVSIAPRPGGPVLC